MSETKETLLNRIVDKVSVNLSKLLQKEIKLERAKLVDGTEVEIEDNMIYVLVPNDEGEPERIPAPVGEHELEDGNIVVVTEEGMISEIKKPEAQEMENEETKEMDLSAEVEQLKKDVAELKSLMKPKEDEVEASKEVEVKKEVESSKETKDEPKETELSKESKEVELSEPQKVKHSPEKEPKRNINLYAQNLKGDTKSRVYAKLFK